MLEKLEKKYEFDFYAGVSAGAIIACLHANGMKSADIWNLLQKTKLFSLGFDLGKTNFGLIQGKKIHELFSKIFQGKRLEDLPMPIFIGATDFKTGEKVFLSRGRIADALRASISVPIIFEPFFHPTYRKYLMDGGPSENLPLSVTLKKYKGNKIFALDTSWMDAEINFEEKSWFGKAKNIRKILVHTIKILYQNQKQELIHDPRVTHIEISIKDYDALDVFKLKEIYKQGQTFALHTKI